MEKSQNGSDQTQIAIQNQIIYKLYFITQASIVQLVGVGQLVVVIDIAVAVGRGYLREELPIGYDGHARAGRDHVGRDGIVVRRLAAIQEHHVDATRIGGVERVGQAGVELQRHPGGHARHAEFGVALAVETVAGQQVRLKDKLKRRRVARYALKHTAHHEILERTELALFGVGEQVAARPVQIGLDVRVGEVVARHGAQLHAPSHGDVRLREESARQLAAEYVRIADDESGKNGLLLGQVANGGGDLVACVLKHRVLDEPRAHERVAEQKRQPHEPRDEMCRADDVRHGVHFHPFEMLGKFGRQSHLESRENCIV